MNAGRCGHVISIIFYLQLPTITRSNHMKPGYILCNDLLHVEPRLLSKSLDTLAKARGFEIVSA